MGCGYTGWALLDTRLLHRLCLQTLDPEGSPSSSPMTTGTVMFSLWCPTWQAKFCSSLGEIRVATQVW